MALLVSKQNRRFFLRIRPLYRNQRQVVTNGDVDGIRFSMLGNPGEVFFAGGGVNNETEEIFSEVVDDKVINHAARCVKHTGVEGFTRLR
ncbi:hypothetical protein NGUA18_04233 [Salmonella enterica]|nr:hypothetical protein NGUA18_04233 [Salmonella enterica]